MMATKRRLVIAISAGVVLVCSAAEVVTLPSPLPSLALVDVASAAWRYDSAHPPVIHPTQDAWTAMFQAAPR